MACNLIVILNLCSQDEVHLTAPCARLKPIDLNECILCQKKKRSEYLSSGEVGRSCLPKKRRVVTSEPLGSFN